MLCGGESQAAVGELERSDRVAVAMVKPRRRGELRVGRRCRRRLRRGGCGQLGGRDLVGPTRAVPVALALPARIGVPPGGGISGRLGYDLLRPFLAVPVPLARPCGIRVPARGRLARRLHELPCRRLSDGPRPLRAPPEPKRPGPDCPEAYDQDDPYTAEVERCASAGGTDGMTSASRAVTGSGTCSTARRKSGRPQRSPTASRKRLRSWSAIPTGSSFPLRTEA